MHTATFISLCFCVLQGTIDMRDMGSLFDGLRLIHALDPTQWTDADETAMKTWTRRYVDEWLVPNYLPRSERAAENNHGNYYDVQLLAMVKYLGRCVPALGRVDARHSTPLAIGGKRVHVLRRRPALPRAVAVLVLPARPLEAVPCPLCVGH